MPSLELPGQGRSRRFLALDVSATNRTTVEVGGTVGDRYFSATAQGQRLYIEGMGEHAEWNSDRLVFYSAELVSMLLKPYPRDRQVHFVQELHIAVEESGLPAHRVWIHEGLVEATRRIWEELRSKTRS